MALGKINEWLEKDKLILLEGWARDGLTDEQIAKNIGINRTTLYDWKKKEVNIADVLKKGKEVIDFEVENALLKRALGYEYEEETYENGILTKKVKKQVPPDTTAQIFWLKNRKKEQWREKVEVVKTDEDLQNINKNISNIANLLNNPKPNRSDEDV